VSRRAILRLMSQLQWRFESLDADGGAPATMRYDGQDHWLMVLNRYSVRCRWITYHWRSRFVRKIHDPPAPPATELPSTAVLPLPPVISPAHSRANPENATHPSRSRHCRKNRTAGSNAEGAPDF